MQVCDAAPTVVRRPFVVPASLAASGNVSRPKPTPKPPKVETFPAPATLHTIAPSFMPSTEAEMAQCLADPPWRICSGQLYKIMVKSASSDGDGGESFVVDFKPNRAQRRQMARLWHRNIILKARRLVHPAPASKRNCGVDADRSLTTRCGQSLLPCRRRKAVPFRRTTYRAICSGRAPVSEDAQFKNHGRSSVPVDWKLISHDALNSIDLDELLRNVERFDCTTFGSEVSRAERDEGRWSPEQRECLRLVGAVLSMMLRPDQPAEPFGPMLVMDGQRSAIPADFDTQGLLRMEAWALSLRDPELRARFLDVLWVQARSFPAAKGAVEAYVAAALRLEHPKEWTSGQKRLERALRLAASLGKGGADLRLRVLGEVEAVLHRHGGTDPLYLTMRLTRLLLEFKHGDPKQFSEYAMVAATTAEAAQDFWRAKDYFQLAAECHRAALDTNGEAAALRSSAECLVKEAELARQQPGRGAMAAASILSDAVEAMRQVPNALERAVELHDKLIGLQKESVGELKTVSTSMDATELVHRAVGAVRDRPLREAVFALCAMSRPPSMAKLKQEVHEQARIAVLGSLFSSQVLNSRGQVIAIAPGLDAEANDPKHEGLRWRMFRQARVHRSLTVQAILNPARTEIHVAHSPDRQDILGLIQHSPWIPPGHAESVMRALVAGFQGDMIVAGHLVPPQLEAVVRHVVESQGGTTSKLESGGVQPERSLGPLLETPEALQAFGEDGVFELQDLFTEQLGTNLRNEVAHGLLGDSGLFGFDVLYAWWLLLRFCVVTSKLVEQGRQGPGTNDAVAGDADYEI